MFLTVCVITCPPATLNATESLYAADESRHSPRFRVRPVPYSQARAPTIETQSIKLFDSAGTISSNEKEYPAQSIASIQSSQSQTIRPIPSKTPISEEHQPVELNLNAYRSSIDEHTNSSGIYSVERYGRSLVLETASPTCPKQRNWLQRLSACTQKCMPILSRHTVPTSD